MEAHNTAPYVHNMTPNRALGLTPQYRACYGAKPDFTIVTRLVRRVPRLKELGDRANTVEADIGFGEKACCCQIQRCGFVRDRLAISPLGELTSSGDDADLPGVQQTTEHATKPVRLEVAPTLTASDTDSDASDESAPPPQLPIHDVSNVPDYLRRPYNWPQTQYAKGWQFRLETRRRGGSAIVFSRIAGGIRLWQLHRGRRRRHPMPKDGAWRRRIPART